MNILYVGSPELFGSGASSIHVSRICEAFAENGNKVDLLLPIEKNQINYFYEFYDVKQIFNIIPCFVIKKGNFLHLVHGINALIKKKAKYDFIVTRNIPFAYLASFFMKNIVIDIHHPPINFISRIAINRFLSSTNIKKIICNSEGTMFSILKETHSNEKIKVLHNGVRLEDFKKEYDSAEIKKSLSIPENSKVVSYIGNTYKGRGIEVIIHLAEKFPNIFFLIVGGEDADNDYYKNLLNDSIRNIIFTGHVTSKTVPSYYSITDLLIVPYQKDFTIKGNTNAQEFSSPIKIFEHLASSKPIIASDLPSISRILSNDINAILVKSLSSPSFALEINNLFSDTEKYNRLSNNALKKAEAFTWKKRAREMISED